MTAVFTGLRRGELAALEWDDVDLDAERPFLKARASTTKNHKEAVIGLHQDVAAELRLIRPRRPAPKKGIFEGLMPRIKRFKADLKKANVNYINARGQRADFHSLRYTLATNLALAGTPPRVAMEIMRRSDMRLTAKTYTDAGLLAVWDKVANLPSFSTGHPVKDSQIDSQNSQIDSQNLVRTSPSLSVPGRKIANLSEMQLADKQHSTSDMSGPVTTSQENVEWSGRQDSNSKPTPYNQVLTTRDSQGDSQTSKASADADLQRVVKAWRDLPANLKSRDNGNRRPGLSQAVLSR